MEERWCMVLPINLYVGLEITAFLSRPCCKKKPKVAPRLFTEGALRRYCTIHGHDIRVCEEKYPKITVVKLTS